MLLNNRMGLRKFGIEEIWEEGIGIILRGLLIVQQTMFLASF